jgi:hypothetical protein
MGGSTFTSDQRTAHTAATATLHTGSCRVTSIQAKGVASSTLVLYDATSATGTSHTFIFGTDGLSIFVPGSGIRFKTGVHAVLTATTGVTITFN